MAATASKLGAHRCIRRKWDVAGAAAPDSVKWVSLLRPAVRSSCSRLAAICQAGVLVLLYT
eukprot:6199955-Pleurochrysis_carterae.AAC.2